MNLSSIKKSFIEKTIPKRGSLMTGIEIKKFEINLNTIAILISFMVMFGTMISKFNDVGYAIRDSSNKNEAQDKIIQALLDTDKQLPDIVFRVAQNEKAIELGDNRVNRIVDNYSNQFSDIKNALSAITTQQALQSQSLQRLEAAGKLTLDAPKELKSSR